MLIVEDNESDAFLIQRAIEGTNLPFAFHFVTDGQQAVQFFDRVDGDSGQPCPHIVILDINLPKKQGGDVLKHMRKSLRCGSAHVIVVSTSDSSLDREAMANLGADGYFRKPSEVDEFMKLGDLVKTFFPDV